MSVLPTRPVATRVLPLLSLLLATPSAWGDGLSMIAFGIDERSSCAEVNAYDEATRGLKLSFADKLSNFHLFFLIYRTVPRALPAGPSGNQQNEAFRALMTVFNGVCKADPHLSVTAAMAKAMGS